MERPTKNRPTKNRQSFVKDRITYTNGIKIHISKESYLLYNEGSGYIFHFGSPFREYLRETYAVGLFNW